VKRAQQHFSYIKVKDIKKYMFEVFTDELFGMLDIEEFVKNEIETKAIVVIDEIDKLVRSVSVLLFY
jgi:ATP-dependent protease HslVU (ClpYQ) ATPase subunit